MEWVLAEALLAQSRDPRVLLATLCRGEASAERVETLRFLLQRLEDEAVRGGGDALPEAAREVAAGYLVPLMRGLRARPAGATDCDPPAPHRRRLLTAAGAALRSCARLAGGSQLATTLAEEALRDLLAAGPAPGLEGVAEVAVEVLAAVGPCLRPREDGQLLERVAQAALSLALAGDGEAAALASGRLLPALGQSGGAVLRAVWGGLLSPTEPGRVGPRLQVLSALAERLLPETDEHQRSPDARCCTRFWQTVQAGLALAEDALTRKRARYLLQRAVEVSAEHGADCSSGPREGNGPSLFWWSEKRKDELLKFWENYILILETLEGNQIHVIKPVLPKLNNLFEYSVSEENVHPEKQDAGLPCQPETFPEGRWLLHPSWHLCIYKRMFESENKILTKEGVIHFLELYETKALPFSPDVSEFIIGPLMDALSESSLYSRSPGQLMGSGSPLGLKLQRFLVTYVSLLPEELKSSFLLKFIQKMTSRHWCAVPILFLSKALAGVPRCRALGLEGLLALRDVLQCTMATHQILLRGAAQGYLLQTAMNLLDVEKVSLSDISAFLLSLRQEESLARGTSLWTELCEWLRVNESHFGRPSTCSSVGLQETCSLNAFVKNLVEEYVKPPAWEVGETCWMPDWAEARLVAMMVLLAVDVEGMKTQYSEKRRMQNVLRMFLDPLLDALRKLGANAYMPVLKADRCLQLLVTLLHAGAPRGPRAPDDEVSPLLQDLVAAAAESISQFVLRRLTMSELSSVPDLDRGRLYLQVFTELTGLHREAGWKRGNPVWRVVSPLKTACIRHLQDTDGGQELTLGGQVQRVVSMAALATVCKVMDQKLELQPDPPDAGPVERFLASLPLNQMLSKPCPEEQNSDFEESSSSQGWGKIAAQYIHDQWVCLSFLLKKYHTLPPPSEGGPPEPVLPAVQMPARTLQSALEALTILPSDQVLPVFHCMKLLVPQLLASSESLCIEAFDMAWKVICSLSNTQLIFWSSLKAFVQFVFDAKVLTIAAKIKGQAYFKIKEMMYKMIEMSAVKTGVFNTLITHCCQSWVAPASEVTPRSLSTAKQYGELVLEACVFGTVFRRDQRLIQDVQTFIENLGHDCAANVVIENTQREDHYVRICAVKFLCLLDGADMSHKLFMEDLAIKLLDKDELASTSRARHYVNSQQHRVKNRVWQVLLVLFPRFDQNFLNRIIDKIFQAGFSNNQASIKYYIEWIIILILHKFPQFFPKFWDCFSYGEEHLKTSICTFLSVLSHFDIITQNIPEKKPPLKRALAVVLRWGLSHNFSVRLYALVALKKIWGMCKTWQVEDVDAVTPVIESSLSQVENMHGAGNAKRNWQRIQDHFFFAAFHPLEDYCLETIFYILPRLSGLIEDEWIPIDKFTRFTDLPPAAGLQGYLCATQLRDLRPGDWAQQDTGSNSGEADSPSEWTDVQKKVIPWKNNVPDLDLELVFQDRASRLGKCTGSLIVVASLIDKPTNLGGLCRTCEVFGASALVVGSLQCVHDRQFQHLSVSAEQWLPLVEVKPAQLRDYLQQKKAQGYTVIGVEQTARSADLTQYCFPEKSLLLLGNEREGIPANLIQQLDVCVEIPQQGIVRSLNVHVSGALLVWEYTRQQLRRQGAPRREALRSAAGAADTLCYKGNHLD
ncbi:TAR (HIV-1) RNA binding protein 1 [Phyllostomus discolor]|uniref:tRNA (guanosine(18)-2'-O)-methyltransferase TARBP1 n=1 Tax=Phyllostomus discolor TaxID=89673 RepID=A0A833YCJ9_9CHIR|nr:TAR (HIV-1) RNA binding protein 1 [Phyllostomus discolor]